MEEMPVGKKVLVVQKAWLDEQETPEKIINDLKNGTVEYIYVGHSRVEPKTEINVDDGEHIGKNNYDVYKESVGGVSFNGQKLKEFEEMSEKIRNAWTNSALQSYVYISTLLNKISRAPVK